MPYLQDAIVTAIALWAGWIVFRRVAGFAGPRRAAPGCANCPSPAKTAQPAASEHPLVFVKSPRH